MEGSTYTWGWDYNSSPYSVTCMLPDNSYVSKSGSLLITKHDKAGRRIEGTFNMVAEVWPSGGSPITVTEGAFAIDYWKCPSYFLAAYLSKRGGPENRRLRYDDMVTPSILKLPNR